MSHPRISEFRFCVGAVDGERSSVWKVWTRGNDVYIQSRMMGSDIKVSLHGSGQCQWSMTDEWVKKKIARNADRHIVRWQLPVPLPSQALDAFCVIIPKTELRAVGPEKRLKRVSWLRAPQAGWATRVEFYYAPPSADPPDTSSSPMRHLVSLQLANGIWLVGLVHEELVTEDNLKILEHARSEIGSRAEANGITLQPQYRAVAFLEQQSGARGIIELVPLVSGRCPN